MRIGIDFDNTIAGYDGVFGPVARELKLIGDGMDGTKTEIRDVLQSHGEEGERDWQRLQGQVYGKFVVRAEMIDGVDGFLSACRDKGEIVFIISHKTEYGHYDPDRANLRDAALAWMTDQGFFEADGFTIPKENVFFEATRTEKIARIKVQRCTHFIDDLAEVFEEPGFPDDIRRVLYHPSDNPPEGPFEVFRTWQDITDDFLGAAR